MLQFDVNLYIIRTKVVTGMKKDKIRSRLPNRVKKSSQLAAVGAGAGAFVGPRAAALGGAFGAYIGTKIGEKESE